MDERFPRPSPENMPQWLIDARAEATAESNSEPHQTPLELPQFLLEDDLPNARQGIEAKNGSNRTIWLTRCIAKKIYSCPCCTEQIGIGDEHTLIRIQSGVHKFDHHHLHKPCGYTWIDTEKPIVTFQDNTANDRRIGKRQARSRNRRNSL